MPSSIRQEVLAEAALSIHTEFGKLAHVAAFLKPSCDPRKLRDFYKRLERRR
jgi:hypothetical protein